MGGVPKGWAERVAAATADIKKTEKKKTVGPAPKAPKSKKG